MATKWQVRWVQTIKKSLKHLGLNQAKQFYRLIDHFENCEDPAKLGTIEFLKGSKIYVARLNDSFRVVYTFDRVKKIVIILAVGKHGQVGSKE